VLRRVLGRCQTAGISVEAAGAVPGTLLIVVDRRDGPDCIRAVEGMVAP
jgi:hypothetical protein